MSTARTGVSYGRLGVLTFLALLISLGFASLGSWQLQRRVWKLALIERTEAHLHAEPITAPGPGQWQSLGAEDVYSRIAVSGEFHHDLETCPQAVTELGPGCWVMTPLRTAQGWWLLVNRGFVDNEHRNAATRPQGQIAGTVTVVGLLRSSEPEGAFLRRNDPAAGHWYSRDVAAIAATHGLPANEVAPYFIDASDSVKGGPVGGLTVIQFRNQHLQYALTWFGLALMPLLAIWFLWRRPR